MDQADHIRASEELNWQNLEDYLLKQIPDLIPKMKVLQFHGGHANLSYLLMFGAKEFVLRRPPFGKIAPRAHDMNREFGILSKIHKHYPRAPKAIHFCDIVDIIGSEFLIMERRQGIVIRYQVPDSFKSFPNIEKRLTNALIEAQTDLHKIDISQDQLQLLGKPNGFLARQIKGWKKRWELSNKTEDREVSEFISELEKQLPENRNVSIIHNDFKFDNCQFVESNPDMVSSVFDWDMSTLGDPLFDFASSLVYWRDEYFGDKLDSMLLKGDFPHKQELKDNYQNATNYNLDGLSWYEALAYWKSSIIAKQLYVRYQNGESKDNRMEKFDYISKAFTDKALELFKKGF